MASEECEAALRLSKCRWVSAATAAYDTSTIPHVRMLVAFQRDALPNVVTRAFEYVGIHTWYHIVPIKLSVQGAIDLADRLDAAEVELALVKT